MNPEQQIAEAIVATAANTGDTLEATSRRYFVALWVNWPEVARGVDPNSIALWVARHGTTWQTRIAPCVKCGGRAFQLVEHAEIWYPLDDIAEDGTLIFDASNRTVSDEGQAQHVECRTCLTPIGLPTYDWR